ASARDHYLAALAHARGGRHADAVDELDRTLALNPRHYWSWCLRGLCHQNLGAHALAVADFTYSLGQRAEPWPYLNRGYSFYVAGQRGMAVRDYDEALRLDPSLTMALWDRGIVRLEQARYDEALADFRAAGPAGCPEAFYPLYLGIALEGL